MQITGGYKMPTTAKVLEGKPIVNIARAEIVTEEEVPRRYLWETASKAGLQPTISEGAENILRVKNRILATNRTEDILLGFELTFTDNVFIGEIMALVDGGVTTYDDVDTDKLIKYESPVAGAIVDRIPFTINIYCEEKDIDGDPKGYVKFVFRHCKGKPVEYEIEDEVFMAPEVKVVSRPKTGESPASLEFLDELPAIV